jgi:hypothetical protein
MVADHGRQFVEITEESSMRFPSLLLRTAFRGILVAMALAFAYQGARADTFTFTPAAVGLTGAAVTADNVLLSNFSNLTYTGATTFSDRGFLSITGFQLGGSNVTAGGLNSTYSLWFAFNGTGHLTAGTSSTDPRTAVTAGVFDTLTYNLVGASGNATFGFSGQNPTVTPGGATQTLGSGTLINGNVVTTPANGNSAFVPTAAGTVTFAIAAGKEGFFSPNPFHDKAFFAFTNAVTTVEPFGSGGPGSGFLTNNGGGNLNFVDSVLAPVPEPSTGIFVATVLTGVALLYRRRSPRS